MDTFFWNSPRLAASLKTIKPFDGIFGGSLNYDICICNYTSGFRPEARILLTRWPRGQSATSTVKSNYFRFATITLNFTHIELSNIVDFKLLDYHCG